MRTYPILRVGQVHRPIWSPLCICLFSVDIVPWAERVGRIILTVLNTHLKTDQQARHDPQSGQDEDDNDDDPFPILCPAIAYIL